MDTSLMDVDVQPRVARALIKGRMLCVTLPEEVRPDASTAQRSKVTGSLVVHMPKARTSRGKDLHSSAKGSDYFVSPASRANKKKEPVSAANPGWAASGTGSDASDRRERHRRVGGSTPSGSLIQDLGGVSLGARGVVTDTENAVGGALDVREVVNVPSGPASVAKQHAVYGDDSDDEPPPL